MRYRRWYRLLACSLVIQACSNDSTPKAAQRDAVSRIRRPTAASSDSTFDTTVVQDVRGVRRFEYVVRPTGPRFTLVVRGDSADNQVAELLLFREGDSVAVQRIEAMPEAPPKGEPDIVFQDVNADGYTDLKVLGSWGTGGLSWWTWHFDPRTSRLVADSSAADPVM